MTLLLFQVKFPHDLLDGKLPTIARKTVLGLPLQRRILVGVGKLYLGEIVGEFDDE